jgi:hypothetical protein
MSTSSARSRARSGVGVPRALGAVLIILTACGGGGAAGDQAETGGGSGGDQPSAGASPGSVAPPDAGEPGSYEQGAATATVDVEGAEHEFTDGTCSTQSSTIHVFQLVSGNFGEAPYIEIYVGDISDAIDDGEHTSPLNLVTIYVDDADYTVTDLTVTMRDGVTAGEFTGTNANPDLPVSGSFTC